MLSLEEDQVFLFFVLSEFLPEKFVFNLLFNHDRTAAATQVIDALFTAKVAIILLINYYLLVAAVAACVTFLVLQSSLNVQLVVVLAILHLRVLLDDL